MRWISSPAHEVITSKRVTSPYREMSEDADTWAQELADMILAQDDGNKVQPGRENQS